MADEQWRIESRQKRIAGIGAHNYFALVGPDGAVVDELHGVNDNKTTGLLVAGRLYAMNNDFLTPEIAGAARIFEAGDRGGMAYRWKQLVDAGSALSGKARYGALGPNSNSFWASILGSLGKNYSDFEPNSNIWTPGTAINLRNPKWWTDHNRFVPPLSGDQSAVNQVYSQADVARTDNGMSAFGASAVSRAADTDSRKSVQLRRLTVLADMSDEDFAAATRGANWRRLLQG